MITFSNTVGHQRPLNQLARAIEGGKLAHAYLFSGPEGVGKRSIAEGLCAALNCAVAPARGCGTCATCERLSHGTYSDLIVLSPDGAFIKIDQVRALEGRLAFAPHEGRYRVIVIDGAERLNPSAANALLKSVEEPRPGTLFVLVSAAEHKVMPTLVSRCQRLRFAPLSSAEVDHVLRQLAPDNDEAERAHSAQMAEGSPGRALALLGDASHAAASTIYRGLVAASGGQSATQVFAAVSEMGKDREQLRQALNLMRAHLRDELVSASMSADASAADGALGARALLRKIHALQQADGELANNVNPALALENFIFRLQQES